MARQHKIKEFVISDFFKHSATLLSSNIASQLIALLAYPIITRLYDPALFGEYDIFLTIVGVMAIVSTGRYELGILLPKSDSKASALFYLCNINNLVFFLITFIFILILKGPITSLFDTSAGITSLLPLLPFFVLVSGLWQTLNAYLLRQKKYKNIGTYNITQSLGGALFKCLLGLKKMAYSGLIIGQFIGQFLATLISLLMGRKQLKGLGKLNKPEMVEVAKEYANFPKYEMPNQLINNLSGKLPILLLPFFFDMGLIGLLSFAFMLGLTPVNLFAKSISQVLFERMSERRRHEKNIKDECIAFCKFCFFVLLPVFLLLLLLPESFFSFLFGEKWAGITLYFKILIPCFFLSLVVSSLSFMPDIFFKQKTAVKIEIAYLILKVIALFAGIWFQSFLWAVVFYVIVVVVVLSVKLYWYIDIVNKYELSREERED